MSFQLAASYEPRGDQDQAISKLTRSLVAGNRHQTLLGRNRFGQDFHHCKCDPGARSANLGDVS